MKIINIDTNRFLSEASHKPMIGFLTGPLRIIAGIIQLLLNAIALLFLAIPNIAGWFSEESPFHANHLANDAGIGILHIGRGVLEFIPGSSCCIDQTADGRRTFLISDHPFTSDIDVG